MITRRSFILGNAALYAKLVGRWPKCVLIPALPIPGTVAPCSWGFGDSGLYFPAFFPYKPPPEPPEEFTVFVPMIRQGEQP